MICVNSVSVYPKSISLKVGTWSYAAYAEVCPSNADCKEVQWHSDNSSVASVNSSSGYIYANGVGTAHIYAAATDGSGCSDYLTVTVSNTVPVTSVTLNRSSLSLEEGQRASLYATVCPDNATNKSVNWTSSNNGVATVSGGVVTAVSKGSARIAATAADGSGCCDRCTVVVTGDIMVTNVSVSPSSKSLTVGATCYLYETVIPSNATNKTVLWSSSNTNVATVNPNSGLVTARGAGLATIYATAQDGRGKRGTCSISVSTPVSVTSINVSPKQKTLSPGETTTLRATVCPCGASGSVIWSSSNTSVATVGTYTGIVTAKSHGTTTITARTANGSKSNTATITVDSREKVSVKKDSHSFYVKFADGKVWKNIGIDLSKREENYNAMYPPNFWYENYPDLIEEEQRYFDNIYVASDGVIVDNEYSVQQIGFLYLLDPFGIEYYMRNHACHDMSLGEMLFFKDRVYKEIFGVWPRLIKVFPDKTIRYYVYSTSLSADGRADYYTDAEILFGEHPIYDILSFISFILDVVPGVSLSLFSIFYPPAGVVLGSIDLIKFLFFSASATSVLSSGTNSIMEEYTSNIYTMSGGESAGIKAEKAMRWVNFVLGTFSTILDAAEVFTPSLNDITTYNRINESNYRVNYNVSGSELSMSDIIARIS